MIKKLLIKLTLYLVKKYGVTNYIHVNEYGDDGYYIVLMDEESYDEFNSQIELKTTPWIKK